MQRSMQTHFVPISLGTELCNELVRYAVHHFRLAGSGYNVSECNVMLADADMAGANHMLTINNLDVLSQIKNRNVEWHNEPDGKFINPGEGDLTPADYWSTFMDAYDICKQNHNVLHGPGLSNLDMDSLVWLQTFISMGIPREVVITYHHYTPDQFFWQAQRGFTSRQHELDMLKKIVKGRRIACSESGYNTPDEQLQADNVAREIELAEVNQLEFWTYYQLNDDALNSEHFGARRIDNSWKPVINSFAL